MPLPPLPGGKSRKRNKRPVASPDDYPAEFRESAELWLAYRAEDKRQPVTKRMAAQEVAAYTPERFTRAVRHTIQMGWQGLREPDHGTRNGSGGKSNADIVAEVFARKGKA